MIEREFVRGVNLPWLRYGCDFGANAWFPAGGLASGRDRDRLRARLDECVAQRLDVIRWFMLCDGRSGLRELSDGTPSGLDPFLLDDVDRALEEVARAGLRLMPVLLDFHWGLPARYERGVQMSGRLHVLREPHGREALLQHVLRPLLTRFGSHPSIAAWDLFNEPEWITLGAGTWDPLNALDAADLSAFLRDTVQLAREVEARPVTVGSASPAWIGLVRDVGLDFYAPHWYDGSGPAWPLDRPVADLGLDRPVVLAEFAAPGDDDLARVTSVARAAGYAGALAWRAEL